MGLHERGLIQQSVSFADLLKGVNTPIEGHTSFTLNNYAEAIVNSGFPGITPERLRRNLLDAYLRRVIDRDISEQGYEVRRPETVRRWLSAYAAASSTTTAYSRLLDATTSGDGVQPAKTTTIHYRDLLNQIWVLDPVPRMDSSKQPYSTIAASAKASASRSGSGRSTSWFVNGVIAGSSWGSPNGAFVRVACNTWSTYPCPKC